MLNVRMLTASIFKWKALHVLDLNIYMIITDYRFVPNLECGNLQLSQIYTRIKDYHSTYPIKVLSRSVQYFPIYS